MSHTTTIKTELKNLEALKRVCQELNYKLKENDTVKLYMTTEKGTSIQLPNWIFPIVVCPENGTVKYDNHDENWGKQEELDKFTNYYGAETVVMSLEEQGIFVDIDRIELDNGDIELNITLQE